MNRAPLRRPFLAVFCCVAWLFVDALALRVSGADVSFYGIAKAQQYVQPAGSAPAAPMLAASNAFRFTAFVIPATNGAATNATVQPPGGTNRTLAAQGGSFQFNESFNTQATLDAAYPTGSPIGQYTLTIYTVNDGIRAQSLSFALINYPPTPQISNLPAGQSIDTTTDFTLHWNSLGGSALDIVQLIVSDAGGNIVFATPFPFQSGALNGASTEATIPANTLPVASTLTAHLSIGRPGLPNTSYSGATGLPALAKDTEFSLITRPTPIAPNLHVVSLYAGQFTLHLAGESNRTYRIEGSGGFTTWDPLFTTNSISGHFDWSDPQPATLNFRAYRAKVGQ